MAQSAYIRFVTGSATDRVSLDDVKQKLQKYVEMTTKTGQQLGWEYARAAFPYTIEETPEGKNRWFYLKGQDPKLYKHIIFGVGTEATEEGERPYIQVVLPDDATHGDKGKANEFCKFLAKEYQAQLQLFNGRIMYFHPR
ncbi:DUF1885 family protein [Bacillaceae bacterium]